MMKEKELQDNILKEIPEAFRDTISDAIEYARTFHKDKKRYNQEPMLSHLLSIAKLTVQVGLDCNSTIASILHEVELSEEHIRNISNSFGEEVLTLLKDIHRIKQSTETEETPEQIIIKYILSSSEDLRPVIIKVLDTLEDVKTIDVVPKEKRKKSLSKALNIYVVLAEYLDLFSIKKEIEENAFKELLPKEYENINKRLEKEEIDEKLLKNLENAIWEQIKNLPFKKEVKGRIKSKYSIYNKLKKYEKEWTNPDVNRVKDLIAFRITTLEKDDCFLILEKLIDKGEMNYDRFKDYISNPKKNGYQAVQFPIKLPEVSELEVEIQILTEEMHYTNTYGTASHIAYKASKSRFAKPTNQYDWVEEIHKQMMASKKERISKRNIPILCKIFRDEVFVFTPKGKIIDLEKGDTVLDYAFKVHTEIANKAISANINGKVSKLSTILKTGDVVEIKTDKNKKCQKIDALAYANSTSTKFKIRNQLSKYLLKQ